MSLDPLAQAAQVLLANQDQPMWLCCLENGLNLAKFAASLCLFWKDYTYQEGCCTALASNVPDVITN